MALLPRPPAPASLVVDLARIVGAGGVSTRDADRLAHGRDAWIRDLLRARGGALGAAPEVVVWPESAEEVAGVLALAARRGIPVVPFGAGSGRAGGARPSQGGIALALGRMKAIRSVDERSLTVEAETGIIGARLEAALARRGFTLGHAPASLRCSTLGGWLATRSAGHLSSLYGKIEDMTLGLELVTARGVSRREPRIRPGPGPDWVALALGGEGCLGALTAATLRVRPLPEARRLAGFRFRSLERGLEGMRRIMQRGLRPAVLRLYDPLDTLFGRGGRGELPTVGEATATELLSARLPSWLTGHGRIAVSAERVRRGLLRRTTRAVLSAPGLLNRALEALPDECLLVIGFEGASALTRAEAEHARALLDAEGGEHLGPEPGEHWYRHRFDVPFRQSRAFDSGLFIDTLEAVATWDRLGPLHREVRRAIGRDALVMAHFGHAYPEGCSVTFSFTAPAGDPREPEAALARHVRISEAALSAILEMGGGISHHLGIGEAKAGALPRELGPGGTKLLSALATAFDPDRIMNPGKLGIERYTPPRPAPAPSSEGLPSAVGAAVGERNILVRGGRTVVRPPDERALAALVRVAHARGIRLESDQGFGGAPGAVGLDLGRLEGVTRISAHSSFVECEAGVSVERLEDVLLDNGLTLGPLHPASRALSVGAALAKNLLVRRGPGLGDLDAVCLAVRGLLPAGDAVETRAVPRSAAGPALSRIFVGAEGRFGIMTKASLRIAPVSSHRAELRFRLPTLEDGAEVSRRALQVGLRPWAARAHPAAEGPELACVIAAPSEAALAAQAAILQEAAEARGGRRLSEAPGAAEAGSFDAVLEIEASWSRVPAVLDALARVTWAAPWLDFMTPEGATIVLEGRDEAAREGALAAAREAGGRALRPSRLEPTPGGLDVVEAALAEALDPTSA